MKNQRKPSTRTWISAAATAIATLCFTSGTASAITVTTAAGTGADAQILGWDASGVLDAGNNSDQVNIRKTADRHELFVMRFDLTGNVRADYEDYTLQLVNQRANSAFTLLYYGVVNGSVGEDNNGVIRGYTDDNWDETLVTFSTMPGLHWDGTSTANQTTNASAVFLGSALMGNTAEGTLVSFTSTQLINFVKNHPNDLVTIIVLRTDAGTGQARFATKEAAFLATSGSGIPGDYAPRLSFGNPLAAVTWTGAVDTDWSKAGNWFLPVVPTNGIGATIPASFTVNYSAPASEFGGLTNSGTLNINAGGFTNSFTWCNVGTGLINVNNGGAMYVNGDFSLYAKGAFGVAQGGSVNATRLLIGSGSTGGTGGQTSSSYGRATNNGGILIASGGVQLNPGNGSLSTSTSPSDNSPHLEINGGYNNLGPVRIRRAHGGNNAPNPLGRDGLVVKGGTVEMTSLLMDGNTHSTVWIAGGAVTNTGTVELKNPTANRPARFVQSGGLYVGGGVFTMTLADNYLSILGGTNLLEGLAFGALSDSGTAKFTNSGSMYIGASGITHNGVLTVVSRLDSGGLFGAQADWIGSAPLSLAGNFAFHAAAPDGTPHNITYNGVLSGTGPLVKTGDGILTLDAFNTYSDATLIEEGTLALGFSGALASSAVVVGADAVFDVTALGFTVPALKTLSGFGSVNGNLSVASSGIVDPGNSVAGTLTINGSLTQTGGAVTHFDLSTNPAGPDNDLLVVNGDLNISGVNTLEISGGGAPGSVHPLFRYTGTFNGNLGDFTIVGPSGTLVHDTASSPKVISISISSAVRTPTNVVWVGNSVQNDWDVQNLTNWVNNAALDYFVNGDTAIFNASGAANPNVNIAGLVQPDAVVVDATSDYTFSGVGSISGDASLTKTNSGRLTIQNDHAFTGGVNVRGGVLSVTMVANASTPSPLGASGDIAIDGGTLEYTGPSTTWTRDILLGSAGIQVPDPFSALSLSGMLTGGSLTKTGNGTLALNNNSNGFTNGAAVNGGVLRINAANGAGSGVITLNGATLDIGAVKPANTVDVQSPSIISGGDGGGLSGVSAITGDSDVTIAVTTGVFDLIGSMATYANTMTFSNAGGASIRFQGTTGSSLATFDLGDGPMDLMIRNSLQNVNIGALRGGASTTLSGRGGSSNNGPTTHHIGANGASTTFDGIIRNGSGGGASTTSIVKAGPGRLTLTGFNSYTGSTTISNGVLAVKDGGGIDSSALIHIVSGAALDVWERFDPTLYISGTQTLQGGGTLRGSLFSTGIVSPGDSVGALTVTNFVTLLGESVMELNTANGVQTNDVLVGQAGLTMGGTLTVTNVGPRLAAGQRFVLFGGPLAGAFTTVNLPAGEADGTIYTWTDNTATDGSITVATVFSPVNPNPTNIVVSVSGGNITISWPEDHTGWTLQTQTNSLSVGLGVNWVDVPNSSATNKVVLPINAADPAVFFRLRYVAP